MKSGRDHPPILDVGGGEDEDRGLAEALSDRDEADFPNKFERQNDRTLLRFKTCKMEADCRREGGQKNVWTGQ